MLKKKQLLDYIAFKLAHLKACVETLNEVRFFDLNVASEDFFAALLNTVYGYSLTNLNHSNLNAVAVDLGDKASRIAVQVTSERTKAKVQKTIRQFSENGLVQDYDTLKVLIIGDRTGDYATLDVPTGLTFLGTSDVIDISDLIRDISALDMTTLEKLDALFRQELRDYPSVTQGEVPQGVDLAQIDANQRDLLERQATHSKDTDALMNVVGELRGLVTAMPSKLLPEAVASIHQQSLDVARDLLKQHKPGQALALLEKQRPIIWPNATGPLKATFLCRLASAKHALGLDSEAGELFIEARQYNPDDEKVMSSVAVGYLLLGQRKEAATAARLVLARNPINFQAQAILVQSGDEPLEGIIDALPAECRTNAEVAAAIGFVARQNGDLTAAKEWFRTALSADSDASPDIKGMLGELIVNGHTGNPTSSVRIGQLNDTTRSEIEGALSLLKEACDSIEDDNALRPRVTWLLNAAVAARILDRPAEAEEHLTRARRVAPDDLAVIYQSAVSAHYRNDHAGAVAFAEKLLGSNAIPHAPLFLAQLQWQAGRIDDAIGTFRTFVESTSTGEYVTTAKQMLAELYMTTGRLDDAHQVVLEMVASDPNNVPVLVTASQLYRRHGQSTEADATLEKAVRVTTSTTPSSHIFQLGNELGAVEKWSDAATILERVVDVTTDSSLTRKYLHACYRSNKFDKALAVCHDLRDKHGPLEFVAELEIAILEQIGDLASARSVSEQYVAAFPDDGKRRVQLATIYLRQRDEAALDAFLNAPPDWRSLPIECGQQLASLYSARKRFREAVTLLYDMRRIHAVGKVHLQYIQTFLFQGNERHEWLEVNEVGVDVAVAVKDSTGDVQWFVIEQRTDGDVTKGELPTTHALAQQMLGKKVGDSVILKQSSMSTEEGTITEIKSKYVHALHESANVFEVRFPEEAGAFFSLKLKEGEQGVRELLQKLGAQEDARRKVFQEANALYMSNPLTIGSVSRILRCNVLEAWNHLSSDENSKIICASAIPDEQEEAIGILAQDAVRLVVDPVSLMTAHALSLADEVVRTVGRLGISQSTIDLITEMFLKQMCINRDGFMRLRKEGETFVRQEVSKEQMEEHLLSLEKIIEWTKANCDVVPWLPALAAKKEERKELAEIIGEESFDTVLSASAPGRALYSDDLRLRQMAKVEFNVKGLATQPILLRAVERGVIDRERYNKAIIQLATAGYLHTSIDAQVLLEAAKQADWSPAWPFSKVTWLLTGQYCGENAAIRVAAEFIRLLWLQAMLPRATDYLIFHLLDCLANGRNPMQVSDKLRIALSHFLTLIPVAEVEVSKMIRAWQAIRLE